MTDANANGPPEDGTDAAPVDGRLPPDGDRDVDPETLREELGRIKAAMGLRDEYPYWWRWWLVEGIGVGLLFPIVQLAIREGVSIPIAAAFVAVLLGHQVALARVLRDYEKPTTGVPSWGAWTLTIFAGVAAAAVGFNAVVGDLAAETVGTAVFVAATAIAGVSYLFMGQLLEAHFIRRVDRYAFYVGGAWLLALAAVVPHVPALVGWEFAVLGVGLAAHNVGSYVALSRI